MSVFALCVLGDTGFVPVYTGWIDMKPKARMESAPSLVENSGPITLQPTQNENECGISPTISIRS